MSAYIRELIRTGGNIDNSYPDDRAKVIRIPGPDRSVTIEGLKSYRVSNRRYRNRRIGDFLKELHLTEGRNTGFKKILDALEANGSPKPEFETDEDRSYFITRLFIHEAFTKDVNERSLSEVLSEVLKASDFSKLEKIIKFIEEKGETDKSEFAESEEKEPIDKVGWIVRRISEFGGYENVSDSDKADIFGFDIAAVSGSIRVFSEVMKRLEMSFMRSFREYMMRVSIEMRVKIKQKIRCGIGAEGDDSSAHFLWIILCVISRTRKL